MTPQVLIDDQGRALYFPQYCSEDLYSRLANELNWVQNTIRVFGIQYPEPRLTCWFGPAYKYSSIQWDACEFHPLLKPLAEQLSADFNFPFNSVLVNYYRNGNDAMGWHRDNEPEMDSSLIASLSFGAERTMRFRKGKSGQSRSILLEGQSLLLMEDLQEHWEHAIPRSKRVSEGRINLTFRHIRTA